MLEQVFYRPILPADLSAVYQDSPSTFRTLTDATILRQHFMKIQWKTTNCSQKYPTENICTKYTTVQLDSGTKSHTLIRGQITVPHLSRYQQFLLCSVQNVIKMRTTPVGNRTETPVSPSHLNRRPSI